MAANITDLLSRVTDSTTGRPVIASLASPGKAIGAVSVTLNDTTNWTTTTAIHFSIYNTTAAGIKDPTTQTDWKGTLSGTTISGLTLTGGTDQAYSAGAKVELTPTARWSKDLYDNISAHANQDGSLKTSAVQNALNIAATSTDWTPLANVPTVVSSNGQKENVLQFTGVNYTDRLQPGTKLQIPRTGTVPTQSMAFAAASSQYASKTSPTGLAFTGAFTLEKWVYLNSYQAGNQAFISRYDGTNGFVLGANSSGQLVLYAGSATTQTSYQSIPLKQQVHVAGTFSAGTMTLYINGVLVSSVKAGTATAITQAGNLQVGAANGTWFMDGYASEGRIWSVAQTQAAIQNNMGLSLTGSETNLVALFQGNGNFNDKTSNANNLTAAGGAIATQAANPYSANEYAIVTAISFTSGNTQATVFTGPSVIPNTTLGTASYSSARAPYGFPSSRSKWRVYVYIGSPTAVQSSPASGTWYNVGSPQIAVPTGYWKLDVSASQQVSNATSVVLNLFGGIGLNTTSVISDTQRSSQATSQYVNATYTNTIYLELAAPTTYYFNSEVGQPGTQNIVLNPDGNRTYLSAECAYL